ncbi:hypothetical protein [Roseixanthobacter glucoisosaccharinicivorans]|uniref:hypothetical protein n=1 Tax=Roseixanthobacter glucoisosaccharinicivorans TaxID=3119923 RepID=UPI0037276241
MEQMKEFLVSIGWDVDKASLAKWDAALEGADKAAQKLIAAFATAAAGVGLLIGRTTVALDDLNFSAQRLDASAAGLQALAYALGQTGGSSSTAALSGLAKKLRTLPSTEGIINLLGVQTRVGGTLRDTTSILLDVVDSLASTSYVQAVHTAAQLGISEEQYNHLRKYGGEIRAYQEEFKERARRLGVDPSAAATSATLLMSSVRGLAADLDLVLGLIAGALAPALGPLLDELSGWLEVNQYKIVSFVGRLMESIVSLVRSVESMVRGLTPVGEAVGEFVGGADGLETAAGIIAGGYLVSIALRMGRTVGLVLAAAVALAELLRVPGARAGSLWSGGRAEAHGATIEPRASIRTRFRSFIGLDRKSETGSASSGGSGSSEGRAGPSTAVPKGDTRVPASVRSNNPGAMWPGPSASKFGSTRHEVLNDGLGQGNKIAIFDTKEQGGAALFDLFKDRYAGKTLATAIYRWSGGNASGEYVRSVAKALGINPNDFITKEMLDDPRFAVPLAKAMSKFEAGREYPMSDAEWRRAHEMFKRGKPDPVEQPKTPAPAAPEVVPEKRNGAELRGFAAPAIVASNDEAFGRMKQTTTIVVNGDVDPNQTAYEVARAQRGVNSAVVSRAQSMVA